MFTWLADRWAAAVLRRSGDLMARARAEAVLLRHEYVGTEHLLLALCGLTNRPAWRALAACGVDQERLRSAVLAIVLPGPSPVGIVFGPLLITPAASRALRRATDLAQQLGRSKVQPEHILLAFLGEQQTVPFQILAGLGVDPRELTRAVVREASWPETSG
jgi:ATP-dependent Clp protease ATP-binding subunit ClpC